MSVLTLISRGHTDDPVPPPLLLATMRLAHLNAPQAVGHADLLTAKKEMKLATNYSLIHVLGLIPHFLVRTSLHIGIHLGKSDLRRFLASPISRTHTQNPLARTVLHDLEVSSHGAYLIRAPPSPTSSPAVLALAQSIPIPPSPPSQVSSRGPSPHAMDV